MQTINLTQHAATPDQVAAGVVDHPDRAALSAALTFDTCPTADDLRDRADAVARMARGYGRAMIGGAPFFMAPLAAALKAAGVTPVYAFSVRQSVDQPQPDGTVRKVAVFSHAGFVPAV